ncbi:MAG: hypothetical protein IJ180_09460 [Bacteroidales bacterium]|nr:hypothetical protein [Bacteroidales bacterium]
MGKINIKPIAFEKLEKYSDSNSIVLMGLKLERTEEGAKELAGQLKESGLYVGKEVTGVRYIEGNIAGEEGRHDYLIEFDNERPINIMKRLELASFVKWTSDFINNYKHDYITEEAKHIQ